MVITSTNMYIPDKDLEDNSGYIELICRVLERVPQDYWRGPCGRIWLRVFERVGLDVVDRIPKGGYLDYCADSGHDRINGKNKV